MTNQSEPMTTLSTGKEVEVAIQGWVRDLQARGHVITVDADDEVLIDGQPSETLGDVPSQIRDILEADDV